jgi:3(or 17)beta-hydroxysteroid dehydrogenase
MNRLKGKVAVITGGASGIGRQCAVRFAEQGARVIIGDMNVEAGIAASDEINQSRKESTIFQKLDVRVEENWTDLFLSCEQKFGAADVLVNGAGLFLSGIDHSPESEALEAWRKIQAVNVEGLMLGCQKAIKIMQKHNGGSIVNISSVAGIKPSVYASAYGSSKGAVRQYTKSVASHCARRGYGIRCNSIHPGIINTPMGKAAMRSASGDLEFGTERYRRVIPLKSIGEPDDIALAALYLASDESRYVTGTEMIIDGGITML